MEPILQVKELTKDFGGLRALDSIDLEVHKDQIVALIGPNGAGKTTFFNCITGIYKPTKGEMLIAPKGKQQKSLKGLKPNHVTEKGLARTFQNIRLFQNMTVLENVMIGRHCRTSSGIVGAILKGKSNKQEEEQIVADSYEVLEKIGLEGFVNEFAKNLPYGAQRRLEIARAMATDPEILLLDDIALRDIGTIDAPCSTEQGREQGNHEKRFASFAMHESRDGITASEFYGPAVC